MVVFKTVDLSIFLLVVDNIRFNSLIKLLNWSLRFFSLAFLIFLMINVFITRDQWIVNNIGHETLVIPTFWYRLYRSVHRHTCHCWNKKKKYPSHKQWQTTPAQSISMKYKVYTHRSVDRCNQSINSCNISVTPKKKNKIECVKNWYCCFALNLK